VKRVEQLRPGNRRHRKLAEVAPRQFHSALL
jgi:hypothetical protein